ncbi:solute carrier family 41 member 1-like isoform X5 [Dermacentor variabilis]|uniref:solute carrier family 41 member 1-like isoform X5 n=1 Tax=Dermacentor variabilis TaxID=34621 RepID=UPI003F5B3BF1
MGPGFATHGIREADRGGSAVNAEMNTDIRNGVYVKADYKLESRRLSHDFDTDGENVSGQPYNSHTASRMDREAFPEAAKPRNQLQNGHVFSNVGVISCNDRDYTADDGHASRRASVDYYRNVEEFRKDSIVYYSNNGAAVTDENLNEPTTLRLKPNTVGDDDEHSSSSSSRQKRIFGTSHEESLLSIFKQAVVPFFLGGLGTVFAGLILDTVQFWPPFQQVTELFIVVPPLLGLKGNLEMTLAARLSTQANLGNMDTPRQVWDIALGNMALVQVVKSRGGCRATCHGSFCQPKERSISDAVELAASSSVQCQACVLSLLSSVFAIVMGLASDDAFRLDQALFVAASSMATAAVASFLLGTVMVLVVAYSGRCRINPDNVATSVVDALGDMTTLAILAGFSTLLHGQITRPWIASVFGAALVVACPAWVWLARGHPTSRKVLAVGWWPIIVAMIVSSIGGYILDLAVSHFSGLVVFQPVINGVSGNLAAIHASRLSTLFAQRSELGWHPEDDKRHCVDPLTGLCGRNRQARVSQLLLLLSIPGHVLFVLLIFAISDAHVHLTAGLVLSYLVASVVLLTVLLYLARCGAYWMWRRKIDPDNALIPLLTGFGDLCGTGFLLLAFLFLENIQDPSVAGFVGHHVSPLASNDTALAAI